MRWIKVEDDLPPDNDPLLVLCWGKFTSSDPLCQRQGYLIFEGFFNRRVGWITHYCPERGRIVTHWMPRPDDPPTVEL